MGVEEVMGLLESIRDEIIKLAATGQAGLINANGVFKRE